MSDHDHSSEPKVWCITHQHVHIATIPRFTYMCKNCGWGQWHGAAEHAAEFGHETYEVEHVMVPLDGLEREHVEALQALGESRARYGDLEARLVEAEAVIDKARALVNVPGGFFYRDVIEIIDAYRPVVLADRDKEVAARAWDEAKERYTGDNLREGCVCLFPEHRQADPARHWLNPYLSASEGDARG